MAALRLSIKIFIIILTFLEPCDTIRRSLHSRSIRSFDLVRIERLLDNSLGRQSSTQGKRQSLLGHHGEIGESKQSQDCRSNCNEQLRMGLDMVKAHAAFGSVGVPSVEDELDLRMFCKLDADHDRCLQKCGYFIQFNMRDYVCKDHFSQLSKYLDCYSRSATQLKRRCGEDLCGPYKELDLSGPGVAQRCRTLVCDLNCLRQVLNEHCSSQEPANFLFDYTRAQISTWLKEINATLADGTTPRPCRSLLLLNRNSTTASPSLRRTRVASKL